MSDDKNKNNGNKDYTREELKKAVIRDADDFQDEFEMVAEEVELKGDVNLKDLWIVRIKVLLISGVFAAIGNVINTGKGANPMSFGAAMPALAMMFIIVVLGCAADDFMRIKFKVTAPSILYISLISMICGIPGFLPFAEYFVAETNKFGLLPLCTPILAYAGIALGKDLDDFRKQGVAIVIVACMAFVGTYMVSLIVAEVLLRIFGVA